MNSPVLHHARLFPQHLPLASLLVAGLAFGAGCQSSGNGDAGAPADQAVTGSRASIVQPADGDTVDTTFEVVMAVEDLTIEPAGMPSEGTGHFHIMVDEPFIAEGSVIPANETHIHYGTGATTAELTLEPGPHTLRLQVADGIHMAFDAAEFGDEVNIVVRDSDM